MSTASPNEDPVFPMLQIERFLFELVYGRITPAYIYIYILRFTRIQQYRVITRRKYLREKDGKKTEEKIIVFAGLRKVFADFRSLTV